MSSDIGPGDKVMCIRGVTTGGPKEGALYTVSSVRRPLPGGMCTCHGQNAAGVLLEEIADPPSEFYWRRAWCVLCFVKAGGDGMFDELLNAKPSDEDEDLADVVGDRVKEDA